MKKLVLAGALLFCVQFASAQTTDFKKDVITYLQASGSASQMTTVLEPLLEQMTDENKAAFTKELDQIMPSLYDKMAESLMRFYTHDDIKQMNEFYNSPVGKKIQATTPKMTKEMMEVGQQWAMTELQTVLMKYMQ